MKTSAKQANQYLRFSKMQSATAMMVVLSLLPSVAWAGGVVTECTEANLRSAMDGGGTVTFACDGTITLASTITNENNTKLDASGHQITISGDNAVRLFMVKPNVTFTVVNVTLANGFSTFGGGVYNDGGTVHLLATTMQANTASADPWSPASGFYGLGGKGGGICNIGGTVCATNSSFLNNIAQQSSSPVAVESGVGPPPPTGPCLGGAIDSEGGVLNLHNCVFSGNQANGGAGVIWTRNGVPVGAGNGRDGQGGAVYSSGVLRAVLCTMAQNFAGGGLAPAQTALNPSYPGTGFTGASGGLGAGGAVCNVGTLIIERSLIASNMVGGGPGGAGGPGWSGSGQPPHVSNGGNGGAGGSGFGGGLFNGGIASLVNCTITWNTGFGGSGGGGGTGGSWSSPNVYGQGGAGGTGGASLGGIYLATTLGNCTVAFNSGAGGSGGMGGTSGGPGAIPGPLGTNGLAGGGVRGGSLVNTVLATNAPSNCTGSITEAGHNLSSDASCAFTNVGSLNNAAPLLGPLSNNGGPTWTMALLPGSPAIDAGDNAYAPPTDQRGIPRPVGSFADIGAYEFTAVLQISLAPESGVNVLVYGPTNQWCRLLTSTNLADWQCVATNQVGTNGTVQFPDNYRAGETQWFYKVALP